MKGVVACAHYTCRWSRNCKCRRKESQDAVRAEWNIHEGSLEHVNTKWNIHEKSQGAVQTEWDIHDGSMEV